MTARARARYELTATDKSGPAFRSFRRHLAESSADVGRFVSTAAAIGGTAIIGGLTALTRRAVDFGDRIGKLSTRLGASTEFLSEMSHAARQTGVSFEQFGTGIQRMTRRIAEGTKGTREAIEALGLDFDELAKMNIEEQFLAVADALDQVEDQGQKVRLAFKLFDTEGVGLVQTMQGGAAAIGKLREEARTLGASLSQEQVANMEQYKDAVGRLDTAMTGLGIKVATSVGPAIADFMTQLSNAPASFRALVAGDTTRAAELAGVRARNEIAPRRRRLGPGLFVDDVPFDTAAVDRFLGDRASTDPNRVQQVEDTGTERTNELLETLVEETRAMSGGFTLQ